MITNRIILTIYTILNVIVLACNVAEARTPRKWAVKEVVFASKSEGWIIGSHRLMHTRDGGRTWSNLTAHFKSSAFVNRFFKNPIFYDICLGPGGEVWLLLIDQLYMSGDGGNTWSLVLDSPDILEHCPACGVEQVGLIGSSHVFVLATRPPPTDLPESTLLTLTKPVQMNHGLAERITVTRLPTHTRKVSWDSQAGLMALSKWGSSSIHGRDEEGWNEIYSSPSFLGDFYSADANVWLTGETLVRIDASKGKVMERSPRLEMPASEWLGIGPDGPIFVSSDYDRSSSPPQLHTRIQRWDSTRRVFTDLLSLKDVQVKGDFLDGRLGWLAIAPPLRNAAKDSICVLQRTDGGISWRLVFKEEQFPKAWVEMILRQDRVDPRR